MHYSEATAATDTPVRTATPSLQRMCTHRSAVDKTRTAILTLRNAANTHALPYTHRCCLRRLALHQASIVRVACCNGGQTIHAANLTQAYNRPAACIASGDWTFCLNGITLSHSVHYVSCECPIASELWRYTSMFIIIEKYF